MRVLAKTQKRHVAPHTGAWIEMKLDTSVSRPAEVAPHTGAWIEILKLTPSSQSSPVAPHTGAWIEIIPQIAVLAGIPESHPTRVRGLKYLPTFKGVKGYTVAPHTGAWIEIVWITPESVVYPSRTPRGCVD